MESDGRFEEVEVCQRARFRAQATDGSSPLEGLAELLLVLLPNPAKHRCNIGGGERAASIGDNRPVESIAVRAR